MAAALRLRERDDSTDAEFCPACGAPFDADSLICVKCGFDKRTGRRVGEPEPTFLTPGLRNLLGLLALVVVGGGGYFLLKDRFSKESARPAVQPPPVVKKNTPAPAPTPPTAVTQLVAAASAVTAAPPTAVTQVQTAAAAATATVVAATSAPPVIDRAQLAPAKEQQLRATLDEKFPAVGPGQAVTLRTAGGVIRRGLLLGPAGGDALRIADEGLGTTQAIDIAALDRNSRLQVDPEYRERFIQSRIQQWVLSTNEPP